MSKRGFRLPLPLKLPSAIMKVDLLNKVALVTGAVRGIGQAIADTFASNGARVIYSDVDLAGAKESAARSPGCKAVALDVTKDTQIDSVVREIVDEFGRLDIVVNNA